MTPAEIIARALDEGSFVDVGFGIDGESAAEAILSSLTTAGYRLLPPGSLDRVSLEKAAEAVSLIDAGSSDERHCDTHYWAGFDDGCDAAASTIRALDGGT